MYEFTEGDQRRLDRLLNALKWIRDKAPTLEAASEQAMVVLGLHEEDDND